ncbi:MAG: hypothetical protein HC836_07350 [Richelia sp. RM2_1_2]|nr:hypothetical protein [Richelia sp. SM2_1_7]NJM23458.1 hypothetical protein [Richelia sp. SM1_7_0]NJN10749.1 hypothetical protein [Richelia sp. RM1_1_1]NJO29150.1 hypothetical protein [Richelia sp. SL_2_1]NJO58171.1 hypothetical protein [Richelia sp. RM2_1_2]
MIQAKLFSLGLVVTLLGCNQSPVASQTSNRVETASEPQQQNSIAEKSTASQKQNSIAEKPINKIEKSTASQQQNSSKIATTKNNKQTKSGKQIGQLIDCDNDGQQDDARMDYNDDGIPDECILGNEDSQTQIDDSSYEAAINSLEQLTQNCQESTKTQQYTNYTVCQINGKPVKASESNAEIGDGLGFWFDNGKVIAFQIFHNGELFIFDNDGNLKSTFAENPNTGKLEKLAKIPDEERKLVNKIQQNGYQDIFKVFNL